MNTNNMASVIEVFCVGGVCVLPRTMQEALRYFEMDSMLSVKERVTFWQINLTVITLLLQK